ncbi:MAG: acetyl-CoA acetyltransferase [Acidimicrobiales bacterium]
MSTPDLTRVPVVVGAGQVTNRIDDPAAAPSPFDLMAEASRQALGPIPPGALTHCITVHSLSLQHGDPGSAFAAHIGADKAQSRCSGMGGSIPQWLVNRVAEMVARGERPIALIAGAEALATRKRAAKAGVTVDWPTADGFPDTWPPLEPDLGVHRVERAHRLEQATTMYALIESALQHAAGRSRQEHVRAVGKLMARFNDVAADNVYSWFPERRSAEEIVTVTAENRMIFLPYPKYVNAVMDVDMGAAVVLTDAQTARDLGCDDVVYLTGWADAHDIWYLSERPEVHRSPALEACGASAAAMADTSVDEIGAFDLYSCFPSSIEVARQSFAIAPDDPRPLTLTGGLPYHGGPGSNYVTHAVANAYRHLAGHPDASTALVHGNGYYLTKHSVGIYSSQPPSHVPEPDTELQRRIDAEADPMTVERTVEGSATVVAYTVGYDRDGAPDSGVLLAETAGQVRTVARADAQLTAQLVAGDAVGAAVILHTEPPVAEGRKPTNLATPR